MALSERKINESKLKVAIKVMTGVSLRVLEKKGRTGRRTSQCCVKIAHLSRSKEII